MAYAEKRGNLWRARWRGPDGTLESRPGFQTRKAAESYGRDQESAIRANRYVDPRNGRITLTEWVNLWFPSLDLEPTTMNNYRYMIEVHILPAFGGRALASLAAEEVAGWEIKLTSSGLSRRTAADARSTLATVLADAVPRYIPTNPAARRKGKGRKGLRRIERIEKEGKAWASPFEALLIAERAAVLSGSDTDFVTILTLAYTGMRWSEVIGLQPQYLLNDAINVHWKLYELNGRFYRGRPKDGSMRTIDIPSFLRELLAAHVDTQTQERCTCEPRVTDDAAIPWCAGDRYVFLGPRGGHFRRSNYSERVVRPASDGWHPQRKGRATRPRMPVLVDHGTAWPGIPLPPWPPAIPGQPFRQPQGQGRVRVADDVRLSSWLPILPDLTPHGLRHGYQTWMDEVGTSYVLQSMQMGHEVPGMRGVYSHVSPRMRADLRAALQGAWDEALRHRASLSPRSSVAALDTLLLAAGHDSGVPTVGFAPKPLPKLDT
ncbi:tyrosine-type recombinase/integrase [Salinispora arenicola]|uniref:tyrosine-type recombinase/integrase n=1 Tax=Salinispora arenicola TaxID=168697 RepID=UPI0035582AB1